jgi:CheY-like chemotaxis protein
MLHTGSYKVLEARHGVDALLVSEDTNAPIHLLITDVIMPKMSGRELADKLLKRFQGLKVLYISGYTDNAIVPPGRSRGGNSLHTKAVLGEGPPEEGARGPRRIK